MGYRHHWYKKSNIAETKWNIFIEDVKNLLVKPECSLYYEFDQIDKPPQVDENIVRFNGGGEEGHETFLIYRQTAKFDSCLSSGRDGAIFSCCKTNNKPYDNYVVACLILAKMHFGNDFRITSDGDITEWESGRILVSKALGRNINLKWKNDSEDGIIVIDGLGSAKEKATIEDFIADIRP